MTTTCVACCHSCHDPCHCCAQCVCLLCALGLPAACFGGHQSCASHPSALLPRTALHPMCCHQLADMPQSLTWWLLVLWGVSWACLLWQVCCALTAQRADACSLLRDVLGCCRPEFLQRLPARRHQRARVRERSVSISVMPVDVEILAWLHRHKSVAECRMLLDRQR